MFRVSAKCIAQFLGRGECDDLLFLLFSIGAMLCAKRLASEMMAFFG